MLQFCWTKRRPIVDSFLMGIDGVKSDRMILNWRTIIVVIGISFGLGVLTAGHKAILAQLGQLSTNISAVDMFSDRAQTTTDPNLAASVNSSNTSASLPAATTPDAIQPHRPAPVGMEAPQRGDVRVVVISDINERYRSTTYGQAVLNAVQRIPAWQPDLVLCVGDMVGGELLSLTPEEIQAMWAGFDQTIFQPIRQAGLPMAIAIGQHDGSNLIMAADGTELPQGIVPGSYVFGQERDGAKAYWTDPERDLGIEMVDRSQFPFQYSFVQNNIFYLVWDASSADLPDQTLKWAEQNLASSQAQQAKMRISISHYPLYAIAQGRDRPSEFINRGDEVRELLERYDVHTHISGQQHAYFPGHVGKLELLNSGALGLSPRSWLGSDAPPLRTLTVMDIFFDGPPPPDPEMLDDDSSNESVANPLPDIAPDVVNRLTTVYTTYNMDTGQVIEQSELPRVIAGPTGVVLRQDVEPEDLTYEDNQPYVQSW